MSDALLFFVCLAAALCIRQFIACVAVVKGRSMLSTLHPRDVMLAVPRAFQRADYLPCILWGRTAQEASRCHTRDKIGITGRLQSRVYTKLTEEGAEERTAYEISALTAQIPMDLL